ncbi:helix-turn-helix transcriptional regulator [Mediterraneibacter massiliensis]|uniref:helix-turn-helix domain-containing protein n=2 Tax=Mediterraneibacter massiliensis TaxID=1720300 RepID=UPI002F42E19B
MRNLRKAKGLSQEELAIKLNVVRQTVSKWEKGLSVPDSSMLVLLAEELDTSVSVLLGETEQERSEVKIRTIRYLLILVCAIIVVVFIAFAAMNSEYLTWDFNNYFIRKWKNKK